MPRRLRHTRGFERKRKLDLHVGPRHRAVGALRADDTANGAVEKDFESLEPFDDRAAHDSKAGDNVKVLAETDSLWTKLQNIETKKKELSKNQAKVDVDLLYRLSRGLCSLCQIESVEKA